MKVLIVEDDSLIGDAIQKALRQEGIAADWAKTGNDGLLATGLHPYDVIVLDIGLPDESGLQVLAALRKSKNATPVLMLTALNTIPDRVRGLNQGADDYMAKPFEVVELIARLRALHRRGAVRTAEKLQVGEAEIDPIEHTATYKQSPVELGAKEFSILQTLFERVDRVVTKSELEEKLYGWGEEVSSNAVEVLVHRIRKKFFPGIIRTVRGVGYIAPTKSEDSRQEDE
jgi:two-component system, OmpR family, response regulator QseB